MKQRLDKTSRYQMHHCRVSIDVDLQSSDVACEVLPVELTGKPLAGANSNHKQNVYLAKRFYVLFMSGVYQLIFTARLHDCSQCRPL